MKRIKILGLFLMSFSLLSGCKFVRPTDADKLYDDDNLGAIIDGTVSVDDGKIPMSELLKPDEDTSQTQTLPITENPVSIVIEQGPAMDPGALLEFFYGESADALQEEGYLQIEWDEEGVHPIDIVCNKDKIDLIYENTSDSRLWVWDNNGDAGRCYEEAVHFFSDNEISQRLMELYPEEDLESCSREEAIAFCKPLAEACGYGEAQVNVYALTKEVLNDFPERARAYTLAPKLESPYSNLESTVSIADIKAAIEAGDEELAEKLKEKQKEEAERQKGEWTEDTEAYLLVYRSVLNGRLLDCKYFSLKCVYVPAYEKVVYVYGDRSVVAVETLEEVKLITEEEALAEALRVAKIDSIEKITLKGISMVYSPRYEQARPELKRRVIDPCWRIDYQLGDELMENATVAAYDDGTVLINAVDGRENKYPKG